MHADEAEVGQLLNTLRGDGQFKDHTGSEEAFDIFKGNEESLHDSRAMAPEKSGHFTEQSEGQASSPFKQSLAVEGMGYPEMQPDSNTSMRSERSNGSAAQHNSIEWILLPSDGVEAQSHPSCSLVDQPTTSKESGGQAHELHVHLAGGEAGNTLGRRYGECTAGEEGAQAEASVASTVLQLQMPAPSQHLEHRPLRFSDLGADTLVELGTPRSSTNVRRADTDNCVNEAAPVGQSMSITGLDRAHPASSRSYGSADWRSAGGESEGGLRHVDEPSQFFEAPSISSAPTAPPTAAAAGAASVRQSEEPRSFVVEENCQRPALVAKEQGSSAGLGRPSVRSQAILMSVEPGAMMVDKPMATITSFSRRTDRLPPACAETQEACLPAGVSCHQGQCRCLHFAPMDCTLASLLLWPSAFN